MKRNQVGSLDDFAAYHRDLLLCIITRSPKGDEGPPTWWSTPAEGAFSLLIRCTHLRVV
jgi:hypothetical protein